MLSRAKNDPDAALVRQWITLLLKGCDSTHTEAMITYTVSTVYSSRSERTGSVCVCRNIGPCHCWPGSSSPGAAPPADRGSHRYLTSLSDFLP